jgi:ABC-type iron transport system FetAB ATPase subunit
MARGHKALGYRDAVQQRLDTVTEEITTLEGEEKLLTLVATLFRTLIDKEVTEGVQAVEALQSEGLQAVFDDMDLGVRAEVSVSRGQVSVDLLTIQKQPDGTVTEASSLDAYGGSVASVQSVLMRVIVILRRGMRPLLLLDESLGAVAESYVPAVGRFLQRLCARLDMHILAVTHNPVLVEASDRAYRIQKVGSAATFKEIRRAG